MYIKFCGDKLRYCEIKTIEDNYLLQKDSECFKVLLSRAAFGRKCRL